MYKNCWFKIDNNVTQDDIWHPIYVKFEKVLNLWKSRHFVFTRKIYCC